MNIADYLGKIQQAHMKPDSTGTPPIMAAVMNTTDIWSGEAALGYAAAAAAAIGLTHEQILLLLDAMNAAQENMTVDEAAAHYRSCAY